MQAKGHKNATINVRMGALQRGYSLLVDAKRMSNDRVPVFPYLKVKNTRTGFFERSEFEGILPHIPAAVRPALEVAYITGWRLRSELLTRQLRHVDFSAGWLRLDPHEAKNDEGREFPLINELHRVLEAQRARVTALEQRLGRIIPWVFPRDTGKPIRTVQDEWKAACKAAGIPMTIEQTPDVVRVSAKRKKAWRATGRREIPARIPHDFRRTAVRNLELAGVPRSVAMRLVGHKTEAMYRRYAITEASALTIGGERLSDYLETQMRRSPKASPLKTGTGRAQRGGGESNGEA
jgi:integrase